VTSRAQDLALAAALFLVTLAAYAGLWNAGFVHIDDPDYVTGNAMVLRGLTPEGLAWALTTDHAGNWFPLTWSSHMLDVTLYGADPRGHHATNVLLHATSSVLLFALLRRTTGAPLRSALAAALFAWHPLRVESVAWVSERKDVLSVALALATLHLWVSYLRRGGRGRYAAALGAFALGLSAKPMLVSLPFLLVVLEVWPLRRIDTDSLRGLALGAARSLAGKLPFLALAAVSSGVTLVVQQVAMTTAEVLPLEVRAANAVLAVVTYLRQLVWPSGLAILYPYPAGFSLLPLLGAGLLLLGLVGASLALRRERPWLLAGVAWFLGALVPVIGLVQVGDQAHADRYTYLPSIGPCWIAAWAIPSAALASPARRWAAAAGAGGVLAALLLGTVRQVRVWHDGATLFAHAIAVAPGEAPLRTHLALGHALVAEGRLAEAVSVYRDALRRHPRSAETMNFLGVALAQLGRDDEAASLFEAAIRVDPAFAHPYHGLGTLAAQAGDFARARDYFAAACERAPESAAMRLHLARALQQLGETDAAREALHAAVALDPFSVEARTALDALERPR
jgi:cytochrome c-type biogenesis protein CcmH/NrfG